MEAWFADQNFKPRGIIDKINLTLIISWYAIYKLGYSNEARDQLFVKVYRFLSFAKIMGKNIGKSLSKYLKWYMQPKTSWSY